MTIVLRFSDFEADTYAEHAQLLSRQQSVWWGWWKKKHEPFPEASVRQLQSAIAAHGTVQLGLVNRAGVYLAADCVALSYSSGEAIPCPDPRQVPTYYRTARFPLWLRFIKLVSMSRTDWEDAFGAVPVGDDTFFDAGEQDALEIVAGGEQPNGKGYGLLHISDLHFGADYAFLPDGQFFHQDPLEQRIHAALPHLPAGVVVSGDLTTRGDNDGLVNARLFLERLATKLQLEKNRIVVVPGNHDILVTDPDVTRDFDNEQHYRTQLLEFYGERRALERIHQFRGADGVEYILVTLNSSRPRDKRTMDFGYVGRDRSGPIMQKAAAIRDAIPGATWLAAVLHHHILPGQQIEYAVPGRPVSLAIDAGELVGLATDLRFDALMHGHEHLPFVGKTSRIAEFGGYSRVAPGLDRAVLVLAAGSASVKVERLTDEMRYNSFNFYEINEEQVHVQLYQYTVKTDPQVPPGWDFRLERG